MNIGFDAKRAFQNRTGLGNYCRTLLQSFKQYYPEHDYQLFAPTETPLFDSSGMRVVTPYWQPAKQFKSLWRSRWMTGELISARTNLYHGLSNELPAGIERTSIAAVVTIHDLIFEKHPHLYDFPEVWMYKRKFRSACKRAHAIIATSEHTKQDIVDLYKINPKKVHVCYQSCSEHYWEPWPKEALADLGKQYHLPENYFLYVGSVIERKNLLVVCKALHALKYEMGIPLVVVGEGKQYKKEVQQWLVQHGMENQVIFLSDTEAAKQSTAYQSGAHFPALYQNARALIYPSIYEGFGIPVLEALVSGIPVIAAHATSLPEVGGKGALYFNLHDMDELCDCIIKAAFDTATRNYCMQEAARHIQLFRPEICAGKVMDVYHSLV